jgi:hypothetical protein
MKPALPIQRHEAVLQMLRTERRSENRKLQLLKERLLKSPKLLKRAS